MSAGSDRRRKKKPDYTELVAAANDLNEAIYQHGLVTDAKQKVAGYQLVRAARWKLCEVAMKLERIPR